MWDRKDFGRVKPTELDGKPYSRYSEAVRKKYGRNPVKILTRLRDLYPELKSAEENNIYNVHMRVAIELIGGLRHQIVHARGRIDDPAKFVKRILEKGCIPQTPPLC